MTTAQSHYEHRGAPHPVHVHEELSVAQRAAVTADARLIVVQGGPGTGKTEAALARIARLTRGLRLDAAWLLAVVTSDAKVLPYRTRLARALAAAGCPESVIRRTMACVVSATALVGPADDAPLPLSAWPEETVRRASAVAGELAPALGAARHVDEARDLVLETMRLVSRDGGPDAAADGDGDWLRRGVGLIEESVRFARVEVVRHLRMLEGTPGWIGDLGRQLRCAGDVARRSRDLRSAVDRALRAATGDRANLERLREWVDVAGIDLTEAARREAIAAVARRRLWEAAQGLVAELGPLAGGAKAGELAIGPDLALAGGARHVVVDDAHDLSNGAMARLRRELSPASFFVTGDQREAEWRPGGSSQFRTLLREAGRAVVLLEAPRFGAGIGRFINALGSRLWPVSEPGGYAPAIARLENDPAAAAPVELWLVRRRAEARLDGGEHPEPIADARLREARVLAAGAAWVQRADGDGSTVVLVQSASARETVAEALEAEGASGRVDVRTVDECQGLEWSTVFLSGLDEPVGGPAPHRAWVDPESRLAVVWPDDDSGRRVWPFSSLLLARRAAAMRDALARRRLFVAAARARTRLVLTGVTREHVAGGESCIAPVEWLRRQLGVADLQPTPRASRLGESKVGVRVADGEQMPAA